MIANYLTIAARLLLRHKLYAFINVFGLSLGIACSILIMLFVRNEWSYDSFHRNADSLFRVVITSWKPGGQTDVLAYVPMPLGPALRAEFPEIAHAARFCSGGTIIAYGERSFAETILFTDPEMFSMFDVEFVHGDPASALRNPDEIVLTDVMAAKYFGSEDPIGKRLKVHTRDREEEFSVAAVLKPMPQNSSLQFDFLANISKHSRYDKGKDVWSWSNVSTYIQLLPGASVLDLEQKMPAFVGRHYAEITQRGQASGDLDKRKTPLQCTFQPIRDVHLGSWVTSSPEERSSPTASFILAGVALLVLTVACINFTTLAIGRSAGRAREVGVRKVLGALRAQLIRQFLAEAFLLSLFSLVTGVVLAELGLPAFNRLANKHLSLDLLADPMVLPALIGLLVIVSVAAGSYPAFFLSRYRPVDTLKGRIVTGGKGRLTKALVILQFGLSIFLIAGSLVMSRQLNLLLSRELGYDADQVLVLTSYAGERFSEAEDLIERLRNRTRNNPDILSVAGTSGAFTQGYDIDEFQYHGEPKTTFVYRVDEEYLRTLRIPLKEGRDFDRGRPNDREKGIIVNEAFLRHFGWAEPATGKRLEVDDAQFKGREVIGVVRDFHFQSLREEIRPVVLWENPEWPLDNILVRLAPGNIPATVEYLRSMWKEVAPGKPFDATFLNDDVQHQYESEMKWGAIVEYSSFFAVSLACLGLFGLATLAVAHRTKEIGIRKILGATVPSVVALVSMDFVKLVLIANLIAWPAAWYALTAWLENYALRVPLGAGVFLLAGGLTLAVAFLTISAQVVKAASANPSEALRYE